MSGSPVLRANDYLFLIRHAQKTDSYFLVGQDMLDSVLNTDMRVIGDRPSGQTQFAVAIPRDHLTDDARAFASVIRRCAPRELSIRQSNIAAR